MVEGPRDQLYQLLLSTATQRYNRHTNDPSRPLKVLRIGAIREVIVSISIGSRPSDHYFPSVCWFVCLSVCLFACAEFFSAVFDPISIKLGHMSYVWVQLCLLEYRGCATPGGWVTPKNLYFQGFGAQKNSSYSFDRIVFIFGYIVERTNTKILSSHFFAISILNPNYDVINDVISGFAKVVVERCGFHHWIAQRISWGEVVSVFLYLLQFPSYDVIKSDADCTPGREPRSVAASLFGCLYFLACSLFFLFVVQLIPSCVHSQRIEHILNVHDSLFTA